MVDFESEYKSLYRPLCLFALQYTNQIDDAEDVVQQVFADVWEKLRGGVSILNLKAYLYQAVKNRSVLQVKEPFCFAGFARAGGDVAG